ncbi:MAG: class I SAM-dependent methyltransferase [Chlorobi bacterium]|nr:class I SAM-dependent methyltransferase [Chlorobiota bacterium]
MTDSASEFYDNISGYYDTMTRFERRIAALEKPMHHLAAQFGNGIIADIACGTGVHTIALGKLGRNVVGFDVSEKMIRIARENARRLGVNSVRFVQGRFQSPEIIEHGPFSLVLCLGNSIPHIPSQNELVQVLSLWKNALSGNGAVVVELLNYDHILESQTRLIGVTANDNETIIRFYDFTSPRLTFNVLRLTEKDDKPHVAWRSTLLTPFRVGDITNAATQAGYRSVNVYSSLTKDAWISSSKNAVLVLQP